MLGERNIEAIYFSLYPQTIRPDEPYRSEQKEPFAVIAAQLSHIEALFLHQSWDFIVHRVILELIASVFLPEDVVQLIKPHPALVSFEAIVDQKIDEDYLFLCSDPVGFSTDVFRIGRSDELSRSVGDYLLVGCVGVHVFIPVFIATESRMDSQFIVIALCIQLEMPNQASYLVVMLLKLKPMVDMAQVRVQVIAGTCNDEI